ncbi:MAG: hypothetical protein ABR538_06665 [Candidatus Binatia bacterium]
MTTISIPTGNSGKGIFQGTRRALVSISGAVALAAVLIGGAAGVAQAADSNDRIVPPNPAEVAILRGLLALQHPTLRSGTAAATAPMATVPTAVSQPAQSAGQTS